MEVTGKNQERYLDVQFMSIVSLIKYLITNWFFHPSPCSMDILLNLIVKAGTKGIKGITEMDLAEPVGMRSLKMVRSVKMGKSSSNLHNPSFLFYLLPCPM